MMMINSRRLVGMVLTSGLLMSLGSCNSDRASHYVGQSLAKLEAADNCDDVLAKIKQRALTEMKQTLEQRLELALRMLQGDCGFLMEENDAMDAGTAIPSDSNSDQASDYSTTNTQVEGVDEADFIKNDGKYIYVLANGHFHIVQAWPAEQTQSIASVEIEGIPRKLYVHNDWAVIYSSLDPLPQPNHDPYHQFGMWSGAMEQDYYRECTYGYNCDFRGDGRKLQATVFDISDKQNPKLMRTIEFSGAYLNSRRIQDQIHTVVTFPEVAIPNLQYWPEELSDPYEICWQSDKPTEVEIRFWFQMLYEKNRQTIAQAQIADFLPSVTDTRYGGAEPIVDQGLLQDCDDFFLSQIGDGRSFLSIVSFAIDAQQALSATTTVGKPGAVYASLNSLYIASRHYQSQSCGWFFEEQEAEPEATTIHKFTLNSDGSTSYRGSGAVKGRLLNQFSMDEYENHLRVATTTGHVPSPDVHSTLSVLAESEGNLVLKGQLDHLAPKEDIRSVRFNGDVGFVVTFKKTDPLFIFDLSDPTAPSVLGELKIPGFSTYMHLLDDQHLLSIGYDAEDHGDFAYFQGIQLQIFDVSQLSDPKILHKVTIGTRGTSSEAATNHLAFNYFRSRQLLAVPMAVCEESAGGGGYGNLMTFNGLMVYHVDIDLGFTYRGGIPHAIPSDPNEYGRGCYNWWTNSNSQVKRSVFMEDWVYSVALDEILVAHIDDLSHPITSVNLLP